MHPHRSTSIALAIALSAAIGVGQSQEASSRSFLGAKPEKTLLAPDNEPGMLEVKFVHDSQVRLVDGRFESGVIQVTGVEGYLDSIGAERHRIFAQNDGWLEAWRLSGELRTGRALHDLTLFYRVEFAHGYDVGEVCDALNAFDEVELAYPLGRVEDPVVSAAPAAAGVTTPDFENNQGYRRAAPLGVDADYGQNFSGAQGIGTIIADVETGWTDDHEDIKHKAEDNFVGLPPLAYPWDHGTAVLGELVGEDNGLGVKGIVYEADVRMSSHQGSASNIPTAVANAAAAIGAGDALVIEAQCFGGPPSPFPCEFVASTFATCETATANGIHIYAAAGNGNNNLDSASYGGLFDRTVRDSGAVMVGASSGSSLNKASFSNYGTRLDAHGWGLSVTSSGYGDLFATGSPIYLREYTASFSGTSSATPIVAGAGIMLNGIHRECYGSDLDPFVLRALMTDTGTPQGSGGQIGPRPNVRAAIIDLEIPRIAITGSFIPGGSYTVTHTGTPGDLYVTCFSPMLRNEPGHILPYGYLFLGSPFFRLQTGNLDGAGSATYNDTIPNDAALSGTTLGYYQGWERFQSGPGVGSFANYLPLEVE